MASLKRKLFQALADHLYEKEYTIVSGPRQSGKTTLLDQLGGYLKQRAEEVFQLTLEDPSVLARLNQHPENLFDFVVRKAGKRVFVLVDEIQYLDDPSNFLKLIFDKHHSQVKIIATGSSAFYIDRKFRDSLAGRKQLFELYTLDFDEFLIFRTGTGEMQEELDRVRSNEQYRSSKRIELESYFNEYLTFGGYPAVVVAGTVEKKIALLKEITGAFLKRDISESNIHDQDRFYKVLMLLAQQTGSLVNANELSRTIGISTTAIENYLYVLQKCFHIQLLRPFYKNLRKELTKMPKVFFHDLGFRNTLLNQYLPVDQRLDKGMLIENYAYIRLRMLHGNNDLRFWRTADGSEVDFVLSSRQGKGEAIEIKFDETSFNPSKYRRFREYYPDYLFHFRAFHSSTNQTSLIAL
ncbi:MAG: ATP-binding protein [Bacteroidetes bacterium]|nr:ATP-binding protein [Bacteroidota bacterium]